MAKMICLCGISGSGKTTWAKQFMSCHSDWLYFNPDEYYARINGDECDRRNIFEVWHSLFRDIHTAAINNRNVLIDSNNLTFHQRMQWIEWFPEFEEKALLIFDDCDFSICCKRVENRKRTISYANLNKQFNNFENPFYSDSPYMAKEKKYWNLIIHKEDKYATLMAEGFIR